jgi:hypothetical protein
MRAHLPFRRRERNESPWNRYHGWIVSAIALLRVDQKAVPCKGPIRFLSEETSRVVGAWDGRDAGLRAAAGADLGEGTDILSRMDCSVTCSFVISRVICSWPAAIRSTLCRIAASWSTLCRTAARSSHIASS